MIVQNETNPRRVERASALGHTTLAMLTPDQCRAARALLRWRQADLSEKSGVGVGAIKDFESCRHGISLKALTAIVRTFQKAGLILYFEDDDGGPGLRLKKGAAE